MGNVIIREFKKEQVFNALKTKGYRNIAKNSLELDLDLGLALDNIQFGVQDRFDGLKTAERELEEAELLAAFNLETNASIFDRNGSYGWGFEQYEADGSSYFTFL